MQSSLEPLPSPWSTLSALAVTLNVVVLGDVESKEWFYVGRCYHEWRRRRLMLWQLLYRYRDHAAKAGLDPVEAWPWGHVEALSVVYDVQLPVDVQTVVLVLGWPWVFSLHYNPVGVHSMLGHVWKSKHRRPDDGTERLLSDGGLLHLVETADGALTLVDMRDPVVGQVWTVGSEPPNVVTTTGQTVLDLLLHAFDWVRST